MGIFNPSFLIFISPLLFSIFLCFSTLIFPMFIHQSIVLIMRLLQKTYSKLGFGLDLLVNGSNLDSVVPDNLKYLEDLGITHFKCSQSDSKDKEDVECAVCLCKIEEGEEIRELRCEHLFHRVCLDRWVGFQRSTCPLCRGSLAPRRVVAGIGEEQGFAEEVILKFTFFSGYVGRCRWWLR
ncbi:E3 ubiquitin-protein ligase RHA2B-like [Telopea speciosissima]|uniref:E3 ubiquitin-protein ligase RHA2B-like n=1 Tax=Telopea speciosissima TaxID=54955 RepID=UPI001CC3E955|nr:E3 ubiquitin-protein ligase RHA2B-like [Telopea speciosissima]